jgi:acetolactate synthase-1/2/3 large subunit
MFVTCSLCYIPALATTVAELLVHSLRQLGVRHVFGLTGHSIFQVTDALYREPGIDFVPTQSEMAAAYMAEGYARAGRQLGVCLVSAGPGVTNMLGGVAHALKECTPLLALSSDVATDVAGKPSNWHEVGQAEMLAPITKRSVTLRRLEDLPAELAAAVATARDGRNGPVFLGIPSDFLSAPSPAAAGGEGITSPSTSLPLPLAGEGIALLRQAQRPIVIAGESVYWAGAEREAVALAEALSAPFGTPYSQKGLLDEDHPLCLGVIGSGAPPYANQFCLESDLVVGLGTSFGEGLTLGYGHRVIPEGARILHVDADASQLGRVYPADVALTGDVRAIAQGLLDGLHGFQPAPEAMERAAWLAEAKAAWREQIAAQAAKDGPIDYWIIQAALREAIDDDAIVIGAVTELMLQRFVARSKIFHTGDFRAIGHGLATAIGVQLACPDERLVCLSGDGSFMMELPELATLARHNLPIPLVVVHNNAYGSMKLHQQRQFEGRFVGTDLHTPDFGKVAEAFGIAVRRVESRHDLAPAIREAVALRRPVLLDVACPIEGL